MVNRRAPHEFHKWHGNKYNCRCRQEGKTNKTVVKFGQYSAAGRSDDHPEGVHGVEDAESHAAPVRAGGADNQGRSRWKDDAVPEAEDRHA